MTLLEWLAVWFAISLVASITTGKVLKTFEEQRNAETERDSESDADTLIA